MGPILVARRDLSLHPQTSEVEPPPPNHWQQLHATDFPRELDDTRCEPMWKNHGKTPRIFRMVIWLTYQKNPGQTHDLQVTLFHYVGGMS